MNDLRYGMRALLRQPGFLLVAVLTLAVGIGANTTIFSVVNGVLLRSVPVPQSNRVAVFTAGPSGDVSAPTYLDWRERLR
jgi:putative ABC transport system permease protein